MQEHLFRQCYISLYIKIYCKICMLACINSTMHKCDSLVFIHSLTILRKICKLFSIFIFLFDVYSLIVTSDCEYILWVNSFLLFCISNCTLLLDTRCSIKILNEFTLLTQVIFCVCCLVSKAMRTMYYYLFA